MTEGIVNLSLHSLFFKNNEIMKIKKSMLPKIAAATKVKALELLKACTSINIILDIWS